ncbi:hypothetical protein [Leptospira kirschneri]|nr:hypothetical protein [Leptospira kirschneri]
MKLRARIPFFPTASSFSSLKGEKEQAKANPDCIQFRQNPIYFSLNSL